MKLNITLSLLIIAGFIISGTTVDFGATPTTNTYSISEPSQDEWSSKTVQGELSGFDCAVVGEYCPTTHRGADYTTGVFNKNDEIFYFVVNIPQSFLQQYFREKVEVEGTVYKPYNHAVEPEKIHVIEGNDRRIVYEKGYFIDEDGQRATFQDGVFRNGKWMVPN